VPQPRLTRSPPVWLGYLITVVLLAVVMAVSLMPSKRGHQD
jgi:heme exporter protein D